MYICMCFIYLFLIPHSIIYVQYMYWIYPLKSPHLLSNNILTAFTLSPFLLIFIFLYFRSEVPAASATSIYQLDRMYDDESSSSPSSRSCWILSDDLRGFTGHLSELGLTEAWPNASKPSCKAYIDAGDVASWVSRWKWGDLDYLTLHKKLMQYCRRLVSDGGTVRSFY